MRRERAPECLKQPVSLLSLAETVALLFLEVGLVIGVAGVAKFANRPVPWGFIVGMVLGAWVGTMMRIVRLTSNLKAFDATKLRLESQIARLEGRAGRKSQAAT